MKQLLHLKSLLIVLLVLFAGGGISAADKTETIDFYQLYDNGDEVTTVEGTGITITFNKGANSVTPKYFTTGAAVRAYGGNYFTVTANGNKITKIVIGFGSPGDGSNEITTDVVTYDNGTWTGTANSVTFTIGGTSGNRRIASIAVTYNFEQGQGTLDPQNSFTNATENATVGVPYTVQEITSLSTGRRSYASSDESVATIDGSGNVTLNKAGETTITVTTAADDTYKEGSASYTLIVAKGTPVLSFAQETVTAYLGTEQNGPKLTNPSDIAVTYEISNPDIATIQPNGYIQPKATGTAIVTVTPADTDAWNSVQASYTLIVEEAFHVDAVGTYKLVTDATLLNPGDQILITYITSSGDKKVLGLKQKNNYKASTLMSSHVSDDKATIMITSDDITLDNPVTAAILEGSGGAWYFHTNDGYLCATSSSYNYLGAKTLDKAGNDAKATISISSSGDATIKFQGSNTRNLLKYNNTNTLFSCYSSGQKNVQIYRRVNENDVEVTISAVGYSTLYYGDRALTVPEGVTATTYSVTDGKLTESKKYDAGMTIPQGEAVVLKGTAGKYRFAAASTVEEVDVNNKLKGSDSAEETTGGTLYYALTLNKQNDPKSVGFYWMNETGTAFTNGAHKAYLALDGSLGGGAQAKSSYLFSEVTTGINGAENVAHDAIQEGYNLNGQRVSQGYRGIVIVNGRKYIAK